MPAPAAIDLDRLVIDEPQPTPPPAGDDFGLDALIAELSRLSVESVTDMAGRFHHARLAMNCAEQQARNLKFQAEELYPDQPTELQGPQREGVDVRVYPQPGCGWPQWKMAMFLRWERQCRMIDKGIGVDVAEEEAGQIGVIMEDAADRAIEAQAKTIANIKDKLGVITWRVRLDDLESEEIVALLERLSSDLSRLDRLA